jgi:hypothetical protein
MKIILNILSAAFILISTSSNAADIELTLSQGQNFNQSITVFSEAETFAIGAGIRIEDELLEDSRTFALVGFKTSMPIMELEEQVTVKLENEFLFGSNQEKKHFFDYLTGVTIKTSSSIYGFGVSLSYLDQTHLGSYLKVGF